MPSSSINSHNGIEAFLVLWMDYEPVVNHGMDVDLPPVRNHCPFHYGLCLQGSMSFRQDPSGSHLHSYRVCHPRHFV